MTTQWSRADGLASAHTPTERGAVSVEVFDGFERLPELSAEWEELFLARPNEPSTSLEWTNAMVRHHVRSGDRCSLMCLRRGRRLAGVVPLVARSLPILGQRATLLTPVSEHYNTHSDLLLGDNGEDLVGAFVSALFRLDVRWDCFRMARLLDSEPLTLMLHRYLTGEGHLHQVRDGLPAYVLFLPESFDEYLANRSAKFRNYLRRVEKGLEAAGSTRVIELTDSHDFEAAYDAVLDIERASWKHEHGTAITAVPHQSGFYRDLCRGALSAGRLHLQWLTLDGEPVAYNLGYVRNASYHYLKTSYDAELRQLSPATYLRARLIAGLIDRGVRHFDFPGEPYEWEAQWADSIRWRKVIMMYRRTLRGRALMLLERLRHPRQPERTVRHIDARAGTRGAGRST